MDNLRKSLSKLRERFSLRLRRYIRQELPVVLALTAVVLIALWLYSFEWSGFGAYTNQTGEVVREKTLWDWLGLLIIPSLLAIGGFWLNASIQRIERERAEKRADTERKIGDDRLKEQTLQTYLDRMSELLLSSQFDNPATREKARTVARARTLTVLRGLDGERKGVLVRFLYEAGLINSITPIIDLSDADLRGANLFGANLKDVNLEHTRLEDANLSWAHLENAHCKRAHFERANLRVATLDDADLESAHFDQTNFEKAGLKGTNLTSQQLQNTILSDWTMLPNGSFYKDSLAVSTTPQHQVVQPSADDKSIQIKSS